MGKEIILKMSKAALAAFLLGGCAQQQYVAMGFDCPAMPALPKVEVQELTALSDAAYTRLVERELRLKEHIALLRVVCEE